MSEKDKSSKMNTQTKHIPKDAQVIMTIMKEIGVTEHEPRVVNQLLEFTYRYVATVLDDARVYASHAKKKTIDLEDVRLAVQGQLDRSFTSPPPRDVLLDLARLKNVNPLPLIKPHCGLRLPPDRYCLSSCNYRLIPATKTVFPKATVPTMPAIKPSVVVKRPPKPVLKFTSGSKVVAKPAVRLTAGSSAVVKMEVDDIGPQKRKHEEDDYDL